MYYGHLVTLPLLYICKHIFGYVAHQRPMKTMLEQNSHYVYIPRLVFMNHVATAGGAALR